MTTLANQIIELRKQGLKYKNIAETLGASYRYVKATCSKNNLRNDDIGVATDHGKGKAYGDWDENVKRKTDYRFEFVDQFLLDNGESRLNIKCAKCGTIKNISSISLRHSVVRCSRCFSEETRLKRERERELDRAEKEWRKRVDRGRSLVQISMSFCECGRLLPFGMKLCEECKAIKARQKARTKEHRRRARERQGFDRTITLEKLYERDHGVCYLCNKTCDWQDFQRINGNFIVGGSYPTVEHVKALCNGGTHSWDNVKLACFACNSKKGRQ